MPSVPLHHFSQQREQDIPFEIGRIETLPAAARSAQPHRHSFYEILWITGGSGEHHIDFERYPIQPETLYFISPGQVHFWTITQPLNGFALLFTEAFLPATVDQIGLRRFAFFHRFDHPPLLHIATEDARPFHELCDHMLTEYSGSGYGRLTLVQSLINILLIFAQRHYTARDSRRDLTAPERLVDDYIRLVDEQFATQQQVNAYATLLGVTAGHLSETVRDKTGLTASQVIHRRLALEAKRLLTYSDKTVAQIAYALQFDDPSYFARFFRRETGTAPGAFRQTIREKYLLLRDPSL